MNLAEIKDNYCKYDWFSDVESTDNKVIFYVKYMNSQVFATVPDSFDKKNVLIHFIHSKNVKKDNFITTYQSNNELLHVKLKSLINEFGDSVTEYVFYEVHDGPHKITFVAETLPKLEEQMHKLYDEYGFDVIHDFFENLN